VLAEDKETVAVQVFKLGTAVVAEELDKQDKTQIVLAVEKAEMDFKTPCLAVQLITLAVAEELEQEHLDLAKEELVVLAEAQTEQKMMDLVMALMQHLIQVEVAVELEMVSTTLVLVRAALVL
jgi:hypothetical protein